MDYKTLSKDLNYLSEHLQNCEWNGNELLTLSKPTRENLLKYSKSSKKLGRLKLFSKVFTFLPKIVTRIALCILLSVLTPWEWIRTRNKESLNYDWLIVSNTSNLRSSNTVDSVMGHFAGVINNKIAYLYLNAEFTTSRAKKKLLKLNSNQNVFVCPKTLSPINTLLQLTRNVFAIFEALALFVRISQTTRQQKFLLLAVAVAQFSRQTMSNSLIGNEVSRISEQLNVKNIIYSYEGNAHELCILTKLNSRSIRKFPYQHAPIVYSQFGLWNEMRLFGDNSLVLTSGSITKDYFQTVQKDLNLNFPIIEAGSSKFNEIMLETSEISPNKKNCVLFLPEADLDCFLNFFEIMIKVAENNRSLRFAIRKHPSLIISKKTANRLNRDLLHNCSISNLSLHEDFQSSFICVFRSSSAAIEATSFGIYPVHFDAKGDFNLNPLDERFFKGKTLVAHSHEELMEVLKSYFDEDCKETIELKAELMNFSEKYFSNPDVSEFKEYLLRNT